MTRTAPRSAPPAGAASVAGDRGIAALRRWSPTLLSGLLMGVVGLVGATRPVLSWDEIATADVVQRSVPQIWHLAQHIDGVLAPYYVAMHFWTALVGDSVFDLRLPSIVAMAVAVAAAAELGRRLFGASTGVVTGLLLCLMPDLSRYAAEARPYAFASLFATLSLVLLYGASRMSYSLSVLGLGLSHVVALSSLGSHAAIRALQRERGWIGWSVRVAAPMVALTPLFWWGTHQRSAQLYWVPPVTAGAVYTFPARLTGSAETAWLLIGLVLAAALVRPGRDLAEMLVAAAAPLMVVGAVSVVGPSFWVARYLMFVLMPAAVVAAAGMTAMARRLRLRSGMAMALLLGPLAVFAVAAAPGQLAVRGSTAKNGSDYRTVAAIIRDGQHPGDVIVYQSGRTMRAGVGYYLRHVAGAPPDVLVCASAANRELLTAAECPDPRARLAAAARVWLVVYGRRADPLTGRKDLAADLATRFRRVGVWRAKAATVGLYAHPSADTR
jgi:mannosyltransferase